MTTAAPASLERDALANSLFLFCFAAALFLSALLLFAVQPLVGKALLPTLGGTPQVWNGCMVFFQAMLLAGYLHAHYSGKLLGLKGQVVLHLGLVALAILSLPIALSTRLGAPDVYNPIPWLMLTLLLSAGLPIFVISATAPLLQKWLANTRHPAARDPYFLYAASNLGSLGALIGYPIAIEPLLTLGGQAELWGAGFGLLALLLALCAYLFHRHQDIDANAAPAADAGLDSRPVTTTRRLRWLALSFAPSSLLLGVTTFITTDIAAVPLFWILPLAIYLLTFVMVFASRPPIAHDIAIRIQASMLAGLVALAMWPVLAQTAVMLVLHLAAFFVTALVCHGELARDRPGARHLTEFYLWLSIGGVLGGAFNALVAPVLFDRLIEYPLVLALACLLRPTAATSTRLDRLLDLALPLLFLAGVGAVLWAIAEYGASIAWGQIAVGGVAGVVACAVLSFAERRWRFMLGVGGMLAVATVLPDLGLSTASTGRVPVATERSFFGTHRVVHDVNDNLTLLAHGTTLHGAQSRDPARALQPLSYYHQDGPFAGLFAALDRRLADRAVAIVGLGTGGLACYGNARSVWTYYEIDPLVEKIARDPRHFTFLRDCPPKPRVVFGDARLSLRAAPDGHHALILIDAFSSDAIPIHLLTREAIAAYLAKLAADGVLALHVSNRYLDLVPVVSALAADAGLVGRVNRIEGKAAVSQGALATPARLVALARDPAALGALAGDPGWEALPATAGQRPWTDDYVNILAALKFSR